MKSCSVQKEERVKSDLSINSLSPVPVGKQPEQEKSPKEKESAFESLFNSIMKPLKKAEADGDSSKRDGEKAAAKLLMEGSGGSPVKSGKQGRKKVSDDEAAGEAHQFGKAEESKKADLIGKNEGKSAKGLKSVSEITGEEKAADEKSTGSGAKSKSENAELAKKTTEKESCSKLKKSGTTISEGKEPANGEGGLQEPKSEATSSPVLPVISTCEAGPRESVVNKKEQKKVSEKASENRVEAGSARSGKLSHGVQEKVPGTDYASEEDSSSLEKGSQGLKEEKADKDSKNGALPLQRGLESFTGRVLHKGPEGASLTMDAGDDEQFSRRITSLLRNACEDAKENGSVKMRIVLRPEQVGRLVIQVNYRKSDGSLFLDIKGSARATEMMAKHSALISETIRGMGIKLGGVNIASEGEVKEEKKKEEKKRDEKRGKGTRKEVRWT